MINSAGIHPNPCSGAEPRVSSRPHSCVFNCLSLIPESFDKKNKIKTKSFMSQLSKRNVSGYQKNPPLYAARYRKGPAAHLEGLPTSPEEPSGDLFLSSCELELGQSWEHQGERPRAFPSFLCRSYVRQRGAAAQIEAQPELEGFPGGVFVTLATLVCSAHAPQALACDVLCSHGSKAPQNLPPLQLLSWGRAQTWAATSDGGSLP